MMREISVFWASGYVYDSMNTKYPIEKFVRGQFNYELYRKYFLVKKFDKEDF